MRRMGNRELLSRCNPMGNLHHTPVYLQRMIVFKAEITLFSGRDLFLFLESDMKIFVFDLDGTLLNKDHQLSSATLAAVQRAQTLGAMVILASGRTALAMQPTYEALKLNTAMISYNGARITYPSGHIIEQRLTSQSIDLISKIAEQRSVQLNLYGNDLWYTTQPDSEEAIRYSKITGLTPTKVTLEQIPTLDIVKALYIAPPQTLEILQDDVIHALGDTVNITSSIYNFLEILPNHVHKGHALQILADHLQFSVDDVIAFGDGMNDLELLKVAGIGVAMDNANPALKEIADAIAPHHDEDGVAQYLNSILDQLENA